jgi:hypothetical protein
MDGSNFGIGGYICQGTDWKVCEPSGFLSKKFTSAQQNYRTHEHEALAVLEALSKWQDKLLGRKFYLVTDNKSLTFFKTQENLTARQAHLWDFICRFDFEPVHIPGILNVVADTLSRYFKNDLPDEVHPDWEYVNIDIKLDPDGDTLPLDRLTELKQKEMRISAACKSQRLKDHIEPREIEAIELASPTPETVLQSQEDDEDVLVFESNSDGTNLRQRIERDNSFLTIVTWNYSKDNLFNKVIQDINAHKRFSLCNDLLFTKNQLGIDVLCIPENAFLRGRRLVEIIIDQAHQIIDYFGIYKTARYICKSYWWPSMVSDMESFCQ